MFERFFRKSPAAQPSTPSVELEPLATAQNACAADLWRAACPGDQNALLSPSSLWLALSMAASGARGATFDELARLLRLPDDRSLDPRVAGQLAAWNVSRAEAGLTLRTVNRLFADDSTTLVSSFSERVAQAWGAGAAERLPFRDDAEGARAHINAVVERETQTRIRELLPAASVDAQTRLVLVSALFFLARWEHPFRAALTAPAPFFGPGGERPCMLMRQVSTLGYAEDEHAQVVELPYAGAPLALVLVVPRARDGLARLERLDPLPALAPTRVDLALPRFRLAPTGSVRLREVLESLGVKRAFDRERADFTALSNPPAAADRLVVSEVFHQAFIDVDEAGTEAAAATAVMMTRAGARPTSQPKEVRADRPFLFFLRDTTTGAWLFVGRLVRP